MSNYKELTTFRFWCQKVLPLVYDDSLSYYELLCKVVDYINNLIENQKIFASDLDTLKAEIATIQKWIDDFNYDFIEEIVEKFLATMIFVTITDAGYIVYTIPKSWETITFNTTGLDIENNIGVGNYDFGHLVLSY